MQKKPKSDDTRTECVTCKGPGENENLVRFVGVLLWNGCRLLNVLCVCVRTCVRACVYSRVRACVLVSRGSHILLMIKVHSSLGCSRLRPAERRGCSSFLHRLSILTCHIHLHTSLKWNEKHNLFIFIPGIWAVSLPNNQDSLLTLEFPADKYLKKSVSTGNVAVPSW